MNMNKPRKRNPALLLVLTGIATIFAGWLHFMSSLTGRDRLDGGLGVLLGLYICSQPVANLLDAILYGRVYSAYAPTRRSTVWWLALNTVVLVIGFLVILIGTTRFARPSA